MKIKAHIDPVAYKKKPTDIDSSQAGRINGRITGNVAEITPKELASLIGEQGHTALFGLMNGKRNKNNMYSQQVLALDFDNKDSNKKKTTGIFYQSVEETLQDEFIQENASFIYRTFSNEAGWDKFRVVFILDKPFTSNEEVSSAYKWLMEKYPNADKATKDSSRLFYGGVQEVTEINFNSLLPTAVFPVVEVKSEQVKAPVVKKTNYKKVNAPELMSEDMIPTYKLMRDGNKEAVKDRLAHYGAGKSFSDDTGAYNFFRSLNMADILGITGNPFHDLFSYDKTPSASIWKPENTNTFLYTTLNDIGKNGNAKSYDIIQIVQKLTGTSYVGAEQYLADVTGIDFNVSDELKDMQRQADKFKRVLLSESFKEQHPDMHQVFGRYKYTTLVNAVIDIFKGQLYEYDGEVKCLTWISSQNIAKRLNITDAKAKRLLNLMTLTKITDKLDGNQLPPQLLKTLEKHQTHYRNSDGEHVKRGTPKQYRSNVYKLGELMEDFTGIEERCERLVETDFTIRALSREYVIRAFGIDEANQMYPQDKQKTISKQSIEITTVIQTVALSEIRKNGYIIINELKEKVQKQIGKSANWTDYKYKQAESEMIEAYELKKISLTNALREEYGITHLSPTARPKLIVKA